MFWALDEDEKKIKASPGVVGVCPMCGAPVVSKCGTLVLWHFAHRSWEDGYPKRDCDSWSEKETQWHMDWKARVPEHMREFVLKRSFTDLDGSEKEAVHRADILNSRGTVIELQHSPISPEDIRERENFYINMIWIWDASKFKFSHPERLHEGQRYIWKHPKKSILQVQKPLFFHFGGQKLFRIERISKTSPTQVTGRFESFKDFLEIYFQ